MRSTAATLEVFASAVRSGAAPVRRSMLRVLLWPKRSQRNFDRICRESFVEHPWLDRKNPVIGENNQQVLTFQRFVNPKVLPPTQLLLRLRAPRKAAESVAMSARGTLEAVRSDHHASHLKEG